MIILNEKEYAIECIKFGTLGENPFYTLNILARYYYHVENYRKKKITSLLEQFMADNYPRYTDRRLFWDSNIEKIASKAGKYRLHEIDGIWITQSELDKVHDLDLKEYKLLAFTLLCLAKLGNQMNPKNNGWVNNDRKEIFELARVTCSSIQRDYKIGELYDLGYLEFPKRYDNPAVRVTYINDDSKKILHVSDFRELGYEYLKYCGESFIRCHDCGILVRDNKSHTKMYCSNCNGYDKQGTKKMICVDCGKEFEVDARLMNKCRCDSCQEIKVRNDTRLRVQKLRNKQKCNEAF